MEARWRSCVSGTWVKKKLECDTEREARACNSVSYLGVRSNIKKSKLGARHTNANRRRCPAFVMSSSLPTPDPD